MTTDSSAHLTSETRLAVVTGGSSGIGRELANQFADDGYHVCLVAQNADLEEVAAELAAGHSDVTVRPYRADLSTAAGVQSLIDHLDGAPVHGLALNAGIGVGGAFVETDLDAELTMIDLNVVSTVRLAKALVPGMVERGSGRVLLTASVDAQMADPYEAVYGATKAFVKTFGESLASELADSGVTVTTFMPGPTDTNFFSRAGMQDTRAMTMSKDDPATVAEQAYTASKAGKRTVTTGGAMTHASNLANKYLPSRLKGAAHKVLSKPGTASDQSA